MSYNAKNHTEQGGEKTVIGGKVVIENGAEVEIKEGAQVTGLPSSDKKLYKHSLVGDLEFILVDDSPTEITKISQLYDRVYALNVYKKAFYCPYGVNSNRCDILSATSSAGSYTFHYIQGAEVKSTESKSGSTSLTDTVTEL